MKFFAAEEGGSLVSGLISLLAIVLFYLFSGRKKRSEHPVIRPPLASPSTPLQERSRKEPQRNVRQSSSLRKESFVTTTVSTPVSSKRSAFPLRKAMLFSLILQRPKSEDRS